MASRERGSTASARVVEAYRVRYSSPHSETRSVDLTDAIDIHVHGSVIDTAQHATLAGMKALVFKTTHGGPAWQVTKGVQEAVNRWADAQKRRPVRCLAAYVIGVPIGPIDVRAVRRALDEGAVAVWMPPVTSAWSMSRIGGRGPWFADRQTLAPVPPVSWDEGRANGMYVLDGRGRLLPEVRDVIRLVSDRGVALSFGHLSPREIEAIAAETSGIGFDRVFLDHPFSEVFDFDIEELRQLRDAGVRFNLTFEELSPLMAVDPSRMVRAVAAIGAEHFTISSDTGISLLPPTVSAYQLLANILDAYGIAGADLRRMMIDNPSALVRIE